LKTALNIMEGLQGHVSGLGIPRFMIDLPGGEGKIPLSPDYVVGEDQGELLLRNYMGRVVRYPLEAWLSDGR
jgi:lysine 2,3-aminomutase